MSCLTQKSPSHSINPSSYKIQWRQSLFGFSTPKEPSLLILPITQSYNIPAHSINPKLLGRRFGRWMHPKELGCSYGELVLTFLAKEKYVEKIRSNRFQVCSAGKRLKPHATFFQIPCRLSIWHSACWGFRTDEFWIS